MVTLWLSWLFVFGSDGKIEAGLEDLVKKIDEANSQIVTLKADFEQRKEISLLTDPIEMTGTFYLRKPDAMMFVFAPEHDLTMVVNQREMITISEKAKKAERLELPKRKTDLTQMLVAERLDTLVSYFSIGRVDKSQTTG
ncbi:MAG: outer membrane lipoprotein carrier protein LolA, partial [Acidobacteria bacterium]|nr:outer membrane lipoprotein carrier protein LolA [Acidobacteriota bacterium]